MTDLDLYLLCFLVSCDAWHEYMAASDCVEEVLLVNGWSSEKGLINVTAEDKKTLLMVSLAKKLNSEVHSFVDLANR